MPLMIAGRTKLRLIKLLHTVIWVFFAGCIVAGLYFATVGDYRKSFTLSGIVALEVAVLFVNRMRCPLTLWAAHYTKNRSHNFDIFLPEWLAHYNKLIFGGLYMAAIVIALIGWLVR